MILALRCLQLATTCKNLFPFAPVVRLALVYLRMEGVGVRALIVFWEVRSHFFSTEGGEIFLRGRGGNQNND